MRADVAGFKALMEDDDMVRQNSSQNSSKERVKNLTLYALGHAVPSPRHACHPPRAPYLRGDSTLTATTCLK